MLKGRLSDFNILTLRLYWKGFQVKIGQMMYFWVLNTVFSLNPNFQDGEIQQAIDILNIVIYCKSFYVLQFPTLS